MKTTDPRDPLDQQIDALLAARPIKPASDFSNRVLAALDAEEASLTTPAVQPRRSLAPILKFALPIAAAVAFALTLLQFNQPATPTTPAANLTAAEAQEIFLLEEGLDALSSLSSESFRGQDFLSTLDALTFEIQS